MLMGDDYGKMNMQVMFVAHKSRLLEQARRDFVNADNIDLITHSSMSKTMPNIKVHIYVLDEAHHSETQSFQAKIDKMTSIPLLGVTATAKRGDNRLLKFSEQIELLTREDAENNGYILCPNVHTCVTLNSKFTDDVMMFMVERPQFWKGAITFAPQSSNGVNNAQILTDFYNNLGIKTALLSKLSDKRLNQVLDDFSAGLIEHLVAIDRIGEGVDLTGVNNVILARMLGSDIRLNQFTGRGVRVDTDESNIIQFINPTETTLDVLDVIGSPKTHTLYDFNYTTKRFES
jgi:superfamily II DNA or RNA helicase